MREEIIERLFAINREFYQTFAEAYAESRQRPQPGILQACSWLLEGENILEIGCGHGQLAKTLHAQGFRGQYTGIDSSVFLLESARRLQLEPSYRFFEADLSHEDWTRILEENPPIPLEEPWEAYDQICAFAFLHHIPGSTRRRDLLRVIKSLLAPSGKLTISTWDFLQSARLRKRILSWEEVGFSQQDVEEGDYLLDWRKGGYGKRYVHHFNQDELTTLAQEIGCEIQKTFTSDGEGGKLGRYHVWYKE
jgi:SAM-dependent methyltransferase